jgi:hypothetical protein
MSESDTKRKRKRQREREIDRESSECNKCNYVIYNIIYSGEVENFKSPLLRKSNILGGSNFSVCLIADPENGSITYLIIRAQN